MRTKTMLMSLWCIGLLSFSMLSWTPGSVRAVAMNDEPGADSVQLITPVVQEVVSSRDDHTRVWEYTREVPVTDEETGVTELVTVRNEVFEKGDNLCYNISTTDTPAWLLTKEEISPATEPGFAYQAKQGGYQISFTGDLTQPWSVVYQVENQQMRLGVRYLGYYDTSNGNSVFLASAASVVPRLVASNKLYYSNAFPGVDIEYVYTKGKFLQNVIINTLAYYQPPAHYGLNPSSTELVIFTELDLANNPSLQLSSQDQTYTGTRLIVPTDYPIVVSTASTGERFFSFEPNRAYDHAANRNELFVHQELISLNDNHYLVEGVPYSWLTAATLPVTIDYETKSGGINGNETWLGGKTYYVSNAITVNSGSILVIQGNAVVKFSANTSNKISVNSGGEIVARGYKFNYIVFTSADDTLIGETVSTATTYAYGCAIELRPGSSSHSAITYCRIRYANTALMLNAQLDTGNSNYQVKNNIIRKNNYAGTPQGIGIRIGPSGNAVLVNNLIWSRDTGLYVEGTASIQLHTIDSTRYGIRVATGGNATVINTLISNASTYSLSSSTSGSGCILNHTYNAFYKAPVGYGLVTATGEHFLTTNPYVSSPNGGFYLSNADCIDNGSDSSQNLGMDGKTTVPPLTVTSSITSDTTWSKVARDTYKVDIGYHYDPVDIVVQPASGDNLDVSAPATLSIDTGVVVSFYRTLSDNSTLIKVVTGGKIKAVGSQIAGNDTGFIRFTSLYATYDNIQSPLRGGLDIADYYTGLTLRFASDPDNDIEYCEFKYGQYGLRVFDPLNLNRPIQNNVFQNNLYGLGFHYSANAVNNLFTDNHYGLYINSLGTTSKLINYIQSNTFYNNGTALWVVSTTSAETTLVRFENNIITSNYAGSIGTAGNNGTLQTESRNNLYWNNQANVKSPYFSLNTSMTANKDIVNDTCPMLVHRLQLIADQRQEGPYHDGFYLAQRDNDASRFPLRQYDLVNINLSGLTNSLPASGYLNVYASNSYSRETLWGTYSSGSYHDSGTTGWGNVLLEFGGYNTLTTVNGDYITLTFSFGSIVQAYLPALRVTSKPLCFWVAQDGSCYYARATHSSPAGPTGDPNQDAYFAMQYDMPSISGDTGLAMSAYTSRFIRYGTQAQARSPAIDKGAVKATTLSGNSTYLYSIFASTGETSTDTTTFDSGTVYRLIPATLSTSTVDPIGRLDLGYHYAGRVVYTTDVFHDVQDNTRQYSYNQGYGVKDIASGHVDSADLTHLDMIIYSADTYSSGTTTFAVGYHLFNTPINQIIPGSIFSVIIAAANDPCKIGDIALTATPTDGTIIAAVGSLQHGVPTARTDRVIDIYKLDKDTLSWSNIASYTSATDEYTISDIAVAANDTSVWVTWAEWDFVRDTTVDEKIVAAVVPISGGTIVPNPPLLTIDWYYGIAAPYLDITYDPYAYTTTGDCRIVYIKDFWDGQQYLNRRALTQRFSTLSTGQISLDNGSLFTLETVISPDKVAIAYNPNDTNSTARAFIADVNDGYIHAFDLSNPTQETWTFDSAFNDTYYGIFPDITYRSSGTILVVWENGAAIYSNAIGSIPGSRPKITTNVRNKRDILLNWANDYDINQDGLNEHVIMVQELLP